MDFSIVEKHKNNLIAFASGAIVVSTIVWTVASNLHVQKIDILETSLRECQRKLNETQLSLEKAQIIATAASASLQVEQGKYSRKQELNSLLRAIDKDIATKKNELVMASPISVASRQSDSEPKGELYLRAEEELESLLQQRKDVMSQLILQPNAR